MTTPPTAARRALVAILSTVALLAAGATTAQAAAPPTSAARAHGHGPSRAQVLKHNRLYKAETLHDVGCAPESTVPLDNAADLLAYYKSVLPCLDKAWHRDWKKLRKAGIAFRTPKLKVHDGTKRSPCGAPLTISYYCSVNETIYMYAPEIVNPWNQYPNDYSHGITKLAATHTLAHEYGHHIQYLVGILDAIGRRYRGQNERRAELQASCLGDAFMSSQRAAYPVDPQYAAQSNLWRYISVANHGSTANQQLWTDRGYAAARAKACNTFKAPASEVS